MVTSTAAGHLTGPPTPLHSQTKTNVAICAAVLVALVLGLLLGFSIWGGANHGPTTLTASNGTVEIQHSYAAKITFVNGNDGVALQPLTGGRPFATVYATVPGTITPKVGEVVNAVIMTVLNPDGSGYQMATLWPTDSPG
jgi:ABC-type branched-subunit amino acid transport system permease subunit